MRPNKFILSLLGSIILAYFFPTALSSLPLGTITDIGIGFIFFFYGLKMAPAELKEGFLNYPSHILIQCTTFLIFPLLTLAFAPLFEEGTGSDLWLALFFLGVLPSTVSSSVVMVAIAKGNLPTAIFNASISGLIGILATPLLLSIFIAQESGFDFMSIILKLVYQIVLPLVAGLFLQKFLGVWARRHNSKLSLFDKTVIVLIVYSSFSNSFNSNLFSSVGVLDLLKLFGIVVVLFFLVYWLVGYLAKLFNFSIKDRITAKFCGTKKSLVHGSVMVKIIFGSSASVGLFLLPIMLYHILQLLVVAIFAENYRQKWLKAEAAKRI